MSEPEDDSDGEHSYDTPLTAPQTPHSLRPSDTKRLPCPYSDCKKAFNRQARLEEHLRSHTGDRIFKCTVAGCGKDFLRKGHLSRHIKSAHSNIRDYKCAYRGCDKTFSTGTRLRRHEEAHKGREKYQCTGYPNCSATFRKHDTLKRHVISYHEQKSPFSCTEIDSETGQPCDQGFETAEKLRQHKRSKHDRHRFCCVICLDVSHGLANLEDMPLDQQSLKPDCYFTTHRELQTHIAAVHPPTCHLCPVSFTTSKELSRHLELQHDIIDDTPSKARPQYLCNYPRCDRVFTKNGNLTVHVKTVHEKRRDFVCGETDVALPAELDSNVEVHGCGRDFTSKASLEEHVRTAHFGLVSRRTERQKKRRHESGDTFEDGTYEFQQPRARKTRKDKGVRKIPTLSTLLHNDSDSTKQPKFDIFADDEDSDSSDFLSGKVTMLGSQVFGVSNQQYSQSVSRATLADFVDRETQEENFAIADDANEDDELFSTLGQESRSRVPLDPLLFDQ